MYQSLTSTVMMVKPKAFGYNPQTAEDNYFMAKADQFATLIHQIASKEFDVLTKALISHDVDVLILEDTEEPKKPDAIFPTWISFHNSGRIVIYPMKAPNRHPERRVDAVLELITKNGFSHSELFDYTAFEKEGKYLEGMGSLVLDRLNRILFACLSPRTNKDLVEQFCNDFNYLPIIFKAVHEAHGDTYNLFYTNVILSISDKYALVSESNIPDPEERKLVMDTLTATGREIIAISSEQAKVFVANAIPLKKKSGGEILVMSKKANRALLPDQEAAISKYAEIVTADINTIENYGGGSIRSMLAEVFLPKAD